MGLELTISEKLIRELERRLETRNEWNEFWSKIEMKKGKSVEGWREKNTIKLSQNGLDIVTLRDLQARSIEIVASYRARL